ncbi:MAG: hypothetical protein V3R26_04990 [Hyphomicrobium sp.]
MAERSPGDLTDQVVEVDTLDMRCQPGADHLWRAAHRDATAASCGWLGWRSILAVDRLPFQPNGGPGNLSTGDSHMNSIPLLVRG